MNNPTMEADANTARVSLAVFLRTYNQTIPESFPKATPELLKEFKESHVSFFRKGNYWSMEDHRKRVMDWLILNHKPRPSN